MSQLIQTFSLKGWKNILSILFVAIAVGCNSTNNNSPTALVSDSQAQYQENIDNLTEQNVRDNLQFNIGSLADQINIEISDGIVQLSGTINNEYNRDFTLAIAQKVNGVRSVINLIDISPLARSESAIAADINDAFQTAQIFSEYPIEIGVEDQTVTLSGTVNLWEESEIAERIATQTAGVYQVKNNLIVANQSPPTDEKIRQIVEQALRWNSLVRASKIQVEVENSVVILSGYIASSREIYLVTNDAYVTGVKEVESARLIVDRRLREHKKINNMAQHFTDLEIKENIRDTFAQDSRIQSDQGITIKVKNGVVTLKGQVDNLNVKQAVIDDVENTVGVVKVYHDLKVDQSITSST